MFTLGSDTAAAPVTPRSEDTHADDTSRAETAGTAAALDDVDLPDDTCATTSRGSCSLDVRPETVDTVPEVVAAEGTSTDEEDWGAHMATACAAEPDSEDDISSDNVDVMVASVGASVTEATRGFRHPKGQTPGPRIGMQRRLPLLQSFQPACWSPPPRQCPRPCRVQA